ncbi:putative chaperone protein DNAj [Trypanosoma vivax]|nr:putative chaperone protein DNAj [Trypanosoma vivax]
MPGTSTAFKEPHFSLSSHFHMLFFFSIILICFPRMWCTYRHHNALKCAQSKALAFILMWKRYPRKQTSHPSNNGAGNLLSVGTVVDSGSTRNTSRSLTTGDGYSYRPGRIARLLRRFFVFLVPRSVHKRLVASMKSGMERVRELEQQQQWLSKHGSPLQVLGLPEHAELKEVRTRYRDMVLETHPDTALVSSVQRQQHYETIQAAYQMATTPSSLWHQNGSAPALYRHLVGGSAVRMRSTALFAAFSYIVMILLVLCFSLVFVKQGLELALRALDPTFYAFMLAQEDKEQLDRLAGEPVSTDPKRLAPTVMKRLLFPGRFLHFSEPEHTHAKQ